MNIDAKDREILRDAARRVAEIADHPAMDARRRTWTAHNTLRSTQPMMLVFPEGAWCELLNDAALCCAGQEARAIEWQLRARIYTYEHFRDDSVIESNWSVPKRINSTGWGLSPRWIPSPDARGARHFDPVITSADDLKKLRYPDISHDAAASQQAYDEMCELFGDILTVTLDGIKHLSYHLMNQYTALRGLEEVMLDMYAEPQMLHDAIAFFAEGHRRVLQQYIAQNLLSFNNDNTYQNSGGNSFTDELPVPGADPAQARPCDMWASAEAQEMALVSPEHHAAFVLQYEKRLLEPFGLTGYGCCEDLTRKLDYVVEIPHLRRISIAPWADVEVCAEKLRGRYIFSWKPNPAQLVGTFNAEAVRHYIRHTLDAARRHGCVLALILKDTHTCEHHPERFDLWTAIAREEIERDRSA
mgnify:CR=1 FL=1